MKIIRVDNVVLTLLDNDKWILTVAGAIGPTLIMTKQEFTNLCACISGHNVLHTFANLIEEENTGVPSRTPYL